jgi:lipid II:glycine glycyltransferase (peptidoglycan interpeptide bridge formation enzyme)
MLRQDGYLLCVTDPWIATAHGERTGVDAFAMGPRTIWIDLSRGKERLWAQLDKQWRYGVGRAGRLGVRVECTNDPGDVDLFFRMCVATSRGKRFRLPATRALLGDLLSQPNGADSEARLFLARLRGAVVSGALVLRCGRSAHYFLGAMDRAHSEARSAEATQWAIIEWATSGGCAVYDLEGIDPQKNPGVYAFKKKMGGDEVTLCGTHAYALNLRGKLVKSVHDRWSGRTVGSS